MHVVKISSFSVVPRSLHKGNSITLSWKIENAQTIKLSQIRPGGEAVDLQSDMPANGSVEYFIKETTTYRLSADHISRELTIKVGYGLIIKYVLFGLLAVSLATVAYLKWPSATTEGESAVKQNPPQTQGSASKPSNRTTEKIDIPPRLLRPMSEFESNFQEGLKSIQQEDKLKANKFLTEAVRLNQEARLKQETRLDSLYKVIIAAGNKVMEMKKTDPEYNYETFACEWYKLAKVLKNTSEINQKLIPCQ